MSLRGCYSIAEDGSKHNGSLIFKTIFGLNYYSRIYDSDKWNPIAFSFLEIINCSSICDYMMKCKEVFHGNQNQQNFFLALLSVQNIFIFGIFFVIAVLCIISGLTILKN